MTRVAASLLCAWFLWVSQVPMPQGVAVPSSPERMRFVDAYDSKKACETVADSVVRGNANRPEADRQYIAWRCLPQGLHPREAQ